MKITVAANSFKGSLSAREASEAAAEGLRAVFPDAEVTVTPIGDGGEGTAEAVTAAGGGTMVSVATVDPLGRPIIASYGILPDHTAVIDLAAASGLTLLKADERNPMLTSTFGTGRLIVDAFGRGCGNIVLCIGGSATNDAATGLLSALGFDFLDAEGRRLRPCGAVLGEIASIIPSEAFKGTFSVAADVTNPFYGPRGAARVYGPQKGAGAAMVERLDAGMRNFADVVERQTGIDVQDIPGSGAAGGTGGAMAALLGARLINGAEMVIKLENLKEKIEGAALVITGEGCIDSQTLSGKGPYAVMKVARSLDVPVLGIGGRIEDARQLLRAGFSALCQTTPENMPLERAMQPEVARENIISAIKSASLQQLIR